MIASGQAAAPHVADSIDRPDFTLDNNPLAVNLPLDNGQLASAYRAKESIGSMKILPLEILNQVLLGLDLPSLMAFRRANRCAMVSVDALYALQIVKQHCPDILRAIVSVRARHFDLKHLFAVLQTSQCATCTQFGNYIYLITCRRVCYDCFNLRLEFLPVSTTPAANVTGFSRRQLQTVPSVLSLPGKYTCFAKSWQRRMKLFDRATVIESCEDWKTHAFNARAAIQDSGTAEARRYMAIISAPVVRIQSDVVVDWGTPCFICAKGQRSWSDAGRPKAKYTAKGLTEHIKLHEKHQRGVKDDDVKAVRNYAGLLDGYFFWAPENQPRE